MNDTATDAALDGLLATPPEADVWVVEVRPEPGSTVPMHHRMRAFLKCALRQYHIRAVRIGSVRVCERCRKALPDDQ